MRQCNHAPWARYPWGMMHSKTPFATHTQPYYGLIGYVPFGICLSNINKGVNSNSFLIGLPSSDVMFLEILFIEKNLISKARIESCFMKGYFDCELLFFSFTFEIHRLTSSCYYRSHLPKLLSLFTHPFTSIATCSHVLLTTITNIELSHLRHLLSIRISMSVKHGRTMYPKRLSCEFALKNEDVQTD